MTLNRKLAITLGIIGLVAVYVLQRKLFYAPFQDFVYNPSNGVLPEIDTWKYVFSKTFRFILNDGFAILLVYGIFGSGKYVKFAAVIFLFGFLVLLPLYLILTINFYQASYAYLNHLHRIVLNPILMMLLIPAFYSQKANEKR